MTRREWLAAGSALALNAAPARRPNIVLMMADDLGYGDLSSYGCPDIRTPHIDSIGARGVRFTQFYSNGPECSPTRTALLTGRYQQRAGGLECAIGVGDVGRYDDAVWLQKQGELGLPAAETSMAAMLKSSGYDTACFGKWHLGYREKFWPVRHGFDESFGILGGNADFFTHKEEGEGGTAFLYQNGRRTSRSGYLTDLFIEDSVRWLKGRAGKPFFLYLPFTAPHTPIQDPDGLDPKLGTAPVRQGHRPTYAKMVERMDRGVGAVLKQLDEMGAAASTIVIFLSDNGGDPNGRNHPWRGRKSSLWEGGIRVPCMIRWPAALAAGKTTRQLGLTMDLLPTLLAAAGAQPPKGRTLDGVDLLPVLQEKKPEFARTVFWRYKRGDRVRKAVREGDLKWVLDEGKEELHNLAQDELEQKDLAPVSGADVKRLKALLAGWERDVMAPRLKPFRSEPG